MVMEYGMTNTEKELLRSRQFSFSNNEERM